MDVLDRSSTDGNHFFDGLLERFGWMRLLCLLGKERVGGNKVALRYCAAKLHCNSRVNAHTRKWPNIAGQWRANQSTQTTVGASTEAAKSGEFMTEN